jgi:hypothetical protein
VALPSPFLSNDPGEWTMDSPVTAEFNKKTKKEIPRASREVAEAYALSTYKHTRGSYKRASIGARLLSLSFRKMSHIFL